MKLYIKHTVIPVADPDRAIRFYTEKLGFKLLCDSPCGEDRWIELATFQEGLCIVLHNGQEQQKQIGNFSNIVFACEDIHALTEGLRERGVEVVAGPVEEDWGKYTLFKDSEGNQFCIGQSNPKEEQKVCRQESCCCAEQ